MAIIEWNLLHITHVIFAGRALRKCLREVPTQLDAAGKAVGPAESAIQPPDKDRCSSPDPAAPGAAAMDERRCVYLAHRASAFVQWVPLQLRQSAGNAQRDAAQPHLWRLFRASGELVWLLYIAQAQVYLPSIGCLSNFVCQPAANNQVLHSEKHHRAVIHFLRALCMYVSCAFQPVSEHVSGGILEYVNLEVLE